MKHLVFSTGERVRPARFEERSLLPVSAACIVANGMRERLSSLTRCDIDLRLSPPAIPHPQAWDAILHGASVHVIGGTLSDAALVLRPKDAHALAALLFGEQSAWAGDGILSPLEAEITRRAVRALASALAPVCGETALATGRAGIEAVTYFELHLIAPVVCCIGVALAREPQPTASATFAPEVLAAALVEMRAHVALTTLSAAGVAALRAGDVLHVPLLQATLCVNGERFASADCGIHAQRFAVRIAARS